MTGTLPNGQYELDHGTNDTPDRILQMTDDELHTELAFGAGSDVQFIHRELERREKAD